ncbi:MULTISPECIES: PTS fructose transporter subunit IIC [Carboxydocella]|uniref:PTS system, fructose-specific IIC component n=2 Tax=Carboxydocella TaxID=178898 RepID=A0A1T4Q801_9FIRM|nr:MULTISPECIES: fructose-specific PTS transporter subunit EIIC [Carboxydocella]AVX21188.1 PTS system D-fructose-specific component, Frc family [Carboxydocella thermautotrophica]AVX31623.1 PTS system D-fructose-specific component, Frc family [Carboxydocella thermautotrophica]GAW30258.1 PTS fructose transporter subunit IIBC [Carboxydocella sp. JDF658]SJZ99338.1 PTS system, fructose-specific IIC component [Carboxydocella sporoproducens DSM 16521]
MKKILAVTACPTGIAHTYMAAEALIKAAKEKNIDLKVETRGAVGVENALTPQEIADAHAIIVAADTDVDEGRFAGKPVVKASVGEAIKNPGRLLDEALNKKAAASAYVAQVEQIKEERSKQRTGAYKHLMNGVSYMIPLVVAGGLLIALSFVFGIKAFEQKGTLAAALMDIGGGSAFALMVPVLSGFIAFSIAEKPGLAPGLVGGMLASKIGAGFLGGIAAGFLAGYVAKWLKDNIKLPKNLEGLKPVLIIPLFATLIVGLLMIYVIGTPIKTIMDAMTAWLKSLSAGNAVLLGLILGAMMAFDMGGPVNKAAYTFAVGLLGSDVYGPMAAVMAAGMTPPLGLWLATLLAPHKYTEEEREAGKAAAVLGISFITEGAIPFAAADPLKVIPSIMIGSAVTGALSMAFGCTLRAPHGGIFVLPIPNAVGNLPMYALAIVIGTVVTALLVNLLKKQK